MFGEPREISYFSPIWGNVRFTPCTSDPGFKLWAQLGLQNISDLFKDDTLMSFEYLKDNFKIPRKHLFKYFQIRSFIHSRSQSYQPPALNGIEELVTPNPYAKGTISKIYNKLLRSSSESSNYERITWMEDFQTDITELEWEKACCQAQTMTINSRLRLIQYNWLMRTYITPEKLHKCNPNILDTCIKCTTEKGTLFHCIWTCKHVQKFWKDLVEIISCIIQKKIPVCPVYPWSYPGSVIL